MRAEILKSWPKMTPEATMTAKPGRKKSGVVKLLTPPPPPDEKTVRKLNALAAKQPFCKHHRVKKHDTL